ncbi:SDR family oxidoreductase [Weeksellaceae bacterium A-14]|uniref:SDR family oxidoreductase n=1 Tax=Daejeonia sp. YH14 TaxID=3439042 RepID=UPI0031E4A9DC
MDFKDKTVLITGGCSGIGKIMARKALERGVAKLIILDIDEKGLSVLKQEFLTYKIPVIGFCTDLSSEEAVLHTVSQMSSEGLAPDILINNAGVVTGKFFHEHSHAEIERNIRVNSLAPMHLTRALLPGMMSRNRGAVCTISSLAGLVSNPKMSVYAASKWAAFGWSDSVRLEMVRLEKDISFTSVLPYYISTGMFSGVRSGLIPILNPEKTAEKIMRSIEKGTKIVALPLPYWFVRLAQGILPLAVYDWTMEHILGIYHTMDNFRGREKL